MSPPKPEGVLVGMGCPSLSAYLGGFSRGSGTRQGLNSSQPLLPLHVQLRAPIPTQPSSVQLSTGEQAEIRGQML